MGMDAHHLGAHSTILEHQSKNEVKLFKTCGQIVEAVEQQGTFPNFGRDMDQYCGDPEWRKL